MAADMLARHMRQRGEDVFFLTGTDEHGEPVARGRARGGDAAASSPTATRRGSRRWRPGSTPPTTSSSAPPTSATRSGSRRSCSGSTTTATSTRAPTRAGTARAAPTSRPSPSSARATPARSTRSSSSASSEENWFFRLSAFQEQLERLYEERPDFVMPDFRRNEALAFIRQGLQDVSLSRPKLKWGVPVPVGPRAGDLRLVRRAAQLLHRARLRPRGRGPDRALLAAPSTSSPRTSSSSTPSTGRRS